MEDHHPEISEDRLFYFETEEVVVSDFNAEGLILDIGGGGEGVIGLLKGEQVVAIDRNRRELEEAAPGPLKVIMDGTDLQFLDGSFRTSTSFYTLMYIREIDSLRKLFSEVYRVLVPGGQFLIWDGIVPPRGDMKQDIAVFSLKIKLPEREIETGYGMVWPEEGRGPTFYRELAESAGFEVVQHTEEGRRLYLELRRP